MGLRSLDSGIAGMSVNQQKLDVISNNISNSDTVAFKSSSVKFQDLLSQSISGAQGNSANQGGINGNSIGLGVKLGSIDIDDTQGSMSATGSATNLGIDGDGYFMVEKGPIIYADDAIKVNNVDTDPIASDHTIDATTLSSSGAQIYYTRDGSFHIDNAGNLVNSNGLRVMGYAVSAGTGGDSTTPPSPGSQFSIDTTKAGKVLFVDATGGTEADPTVVVAQDTNLKSIIIPTEVYPDDSSTTPLKITKISIDQKGLITATLSDKSQTAIGQIAMASFSNPKGLNATGGNLYEVTTNSGNAITRTGTGTAANDNSNAYGKTNSGYVEASNVDLTRQFTDMITTTKAFQANGKTITNADTILQTIINLKQ